MSGNVNDGVNLSLGDRFSAYAGDAGRRTWSNCPFIRITDWSRGHFRGPKTFKPKGLPDRIEEDLAPDGIGTKVIMVVAANNPKTAARNLMAMCCGDVTRYGGLPALFTNVLDVRALGKTATSREYQFCLQLIDGLEDCANILGVSLYKGETAELGVCVGTEIADTTIAFNWAGTAYGLFDPERIIVGDKVRAGHVLVALHEPSPRSNGLSTYRAILKDNWGDRCYSDPEAQQYIRWAASPCTLYDRFLAEVNGWFNAELKRLVEVDYIAHITGGGIPGKLGGDLLFREGLSAELDDLWDPPAMMQQFGDWGAMPSKERYHKWPSGQGVIAAMHEDDVELFAEKAAEYDIRARVCGRVTKEPLPRLTIHSKYSDGETIVYRPEDLV